MNDQWGDGSAEDTVTIVGTVKWFNAVKGFGFVSPNDGTGDVFLHLSCLRDAGYDSVQEGAAITCEAVRRPKGLQAVRVTRLDNGSVKNDGASSSPRRQRTPFSLHQSHHHSYHHHGSGNDNRWQGSQPTGEFVDAQVKWFSAMKGYGFLSCGDSAQDVFVHIESLRRVGLSDLQPGQTVRIKIGPGPKGPQVVDIQAAS